MPSPLARRSPLTLARAFVTVAVTVAVTGCTDDDRGEEHAAIGEITVTVFGAGTLSTRTWNRSSSCVAVVDAGYGSTTCVFPIEDDGAEVVFAPLDPAVTVDFEVSACGKPAADDSFDVRGVGIALRPRAVLFGVGCPSYPVRITATFHGATTPTRATTPTTPRTARIRPPTPAIEGPFLVVTNAPRLRSTERQA